MVHYENVNFEINPDSAKGFMSRGIAQASIAWLLGRGCKGSSCGFDVGL